MTRKVRSKIKEMNEQAEFMNQQSSNDQQGAAFQSKEPSTVNNGDYIDFEEVK